MLELRAGRLRCELSPELGGCIAGLWLDGEPVLRSTPAAQLAAARLAGANALVPFSNRIGHASLVWQGTQPPLVRHDGDAPHAIHGAGVHRPWTVLENDAASAMLSLEHRPDAAWPFAFDCSHTLRLASTGLEMTLALTNQSDRPAPAGLGWNPCFVKRPGSRIAFEATRRWVLGTDRLPTASVPSPGLDVGCDELEADDCYEGWSGIARLRDARMQVTVRSALARLVVFTLPASDCIAIAPVSHAANAVHLYAQGRPTDHLGVRVLQPGETLMAQMSLDVEALP